MSNSKIGAVQFRSLLGFAESPRATRLQALERPGLDGLDYRDLGLGSEPFQVRGLIDVTSASACKTMVETVRALRGTMVTVYDDRANAWNYVMVEDVRLVAVAQVLTPVGYLNSGATHDLAFDIQLRLTT